MDHDLKGSVPRRVVIAGAGLGGLTLAHRLRGAGVDVVVVERDATPFSRTQGFRITGDQDGFDALRRSVPPELYRQILETSGPPGGHFRFTNERLRDAFVMNFDPATSSERQIDRAVLRQILLSTISDRVTFGRQALGLREDANGVELQFADGSGERADLVVVADGIGSRLRPLVFPETNPIDTGRGGIYGRAILHQDEMSLVPENLTDSGFLALLPTPGSAFFFTTMRFTTPPANVLGASASDSRIDDMTDYVMWGLVLTPEDMTAATADSSPEALLDRARSGVATAHPLIRNLVTYTDPASVLLSRFSAGRRPGAAAMSKVAVIGDALHPMPPFGAHGGNTALRDAATLGDHLLAPATAQTLEASVAAYHEDMTGYAFAAVDAAMSQMNRLGTSNPFQRWMLRRLLPALRRPTLPSQWPPVDAESQPIAAR